ncbi:Uncharacterized protein SCF082_LOCUS7716, partial [Durusdinium trenchii]
VNLYVHDDGSCNPADQMTPDDWQAFFLTLSAQMLHMQQASQYFVQVALQIDTKTSKVESTVLLSDAQVNFRHLIEGSKKLGIPAPPSQTVLDELLMAVEIWDTLQVEMNQELHADHIAEVTLERVELLSHEILHELEHVMNLSIPM